MVEYYRVFLSVPWVWAVQVTDTEIGKRCNESERKGRPKKKNWSKW